MKQMKIRAYSLLIALLLVFLSSCAAPLKDTSEVASPSETLQEDIPVTDTAEQKNSYAEKIASLPNADFQGASFRIATDSKELIITSANSSFAGKEQYLRNLAVEEKYNVRLTLTDDSGLPTIGERVKTEALAGTDFCDLVILESPLFYPLASEDLLYNVRTIPYLELNGDGIHPASLSATTLGSMTYGFSGDFTFQPDDLFGVFFNKTLLSQTELPDLYQLVRDNQWDFDNFLLYTEEVFSVSLAKGNRIGGFTSTENREGLINILWAASGQSFLQNDYGTRPFLRYDNDTTDSFIELAQKLLFRTTAFFESSETAVHNFAAGECFIFIAPLSTAKELVGTGTDWGLVPLPKQDINQPYFYSYMKPTCYFAGFVKGTPNFDLSGAVTNALALATTGMTQKIAVTNYLNLYFNSIEDVEMMERIMATPYYDPVEFFGQMDASFSAATQTLLYRVISSEGRFQTLYNQYTKMLEKYFNDNL